MSWWVTAILVTLSWWTAWQLSRRQTIERAVHYTIAAVATTFTLTRGEAAFASFMEDLEEVRKTEKAAIRELFRELQEGDHDFPSSTY